MRRGEPLEVLVYDGLDACSYLPGRTARLPLRLPDRTLSGAELDERLAAGDRRSGRFLYRPQCPHCQACQAIRIPVDRFVPSRTQRRVLRRGDERLHLRIGPSVADQRRVALFNRHKHSRGLDSHGLAYTIDDYHSFLVETCCDTIELSYWDAETLVAIAVSDRGLTAVSAVYCFFDVDHESWSPGAYSILKQIELCQQWGLRYLYLGLYIAQCPQMVYKATYFPHERLIRGQWQAFSKEQPA